MCLVATALVRNRPAADASRYATDREPSARPRLPVPPQGDVAMGRHSGQVEPIAHRACRRVMTGTQDALRSKGIERTLLAKRWRLRELSGSRGEKGARAK